VEALKQAADLGKALESGNSEDANNALKNLAEMGADFEIQEFDKTDAVDAPSDFPEDIIYDNGKILSSSENNYNSDFNFSLEIKTKDDLAKVKEFYKKVLAENDWKIISQENRSDGGYFQADKNLGNENIVVDIYADAYSKLVQIDLDYSRYNQ